MCVYMYIYVYICVCVYICIYMYVYICVCVYIHTHTHAHTGYLMPGFASMCPNDVFPEYSLWTGLSAGCWGHGLNKTVLSWPS